MRPSQTIAAVALGWIAVTAIVGALLFEARKTEIRRVHRTAEALTMTLEAHTAQVFQTVDHSLAVIAEDLARRPKLAKFDPGFQDLLQQRLRQLPSARAIFVVGPDGALLHNTGHPRTAELSLSDRDYFRLHQAFPRLESSISDPVFSRTGNGWFVAATRRLGSQAAFRGIVVAAVTPAYFETLYKKLQLAKGDSIFLFHRNSLLIARYPKQSGFIGKSFASEPMFATYLPRSLSGTYQTDSGLPEPPRIVSYRTVEGIPLVVAVAQEKDTALAQWRRTALMATATMVVLIALLAFILTQYVRQKRRRDMAREKQVQAEKMEAIGQITSGVAHDFANLLNIISINLRIISMRRLDAAQTVQAVGAAQRALERCSGLISRLLAFVRRQPLQAGPADLNAMVAGAKDMLAQAAGEGVNIVFEPGHDLAPCMMDETQFEVALINLVVNARDAMKGKGQITLQTFDCTEETGPIGEHDPNGYVGLTVKDNGPGMTPRQLEHATEPFFTTKGDKGTGLGLSQVNGFMHQVGGSARIISAPGKGTTVCLFFAKANEPLPLPRQEGNQMPAAYQDPYQRAPLEQQGPAA